MKAVGVEGLLAEGIPPKWIVQGVVPEGGLVVISGDPYTSKSFSALEMCRAVASATPFMGYFPVMHEGIALYIGEDSPTWDLAAQVRKLLAGADMLGAKTPEGMLFANKRGVNLDTDQGLERILSAVASYEPTLVVLDSLREMHDQDENDSQVMRRIMKRVRHITERGPAVAVIHHNSKPGQDGGLRSAIHRGRGSSAINGAADAALSIGRGHEPDRFIVEVGKSRSLAVRGWQYDLVWSPDTAQFWVVDEVGNEERAVLEALGEGELKTAEIEAIVKKLRPKAKGAALQRFTYRMLSQMTASGRLIHTRRGLYAKAPSVSIEPYGMAPLDPPPPETPQGEEG